MASGIQEIVERPKTVPPIAPVPLGTLKTSDSFWREFFRVQFDKLILLVLVFGLLLLHHDDLAKIAVGGLVYSLQAQRFKLG